MSGIYLEGNREYGEKFILKHFDHLQNKPLNYFDVLKSLQIINEYDNLEIRSYLSAGGKPWSTTLGLQAIDSQPRSLVVDYNNFGSKFISKHRFNVSFDYGNLITDGDMFSADLLTGKTYDDLNNVYLRYAIPLNGYGTSLALAGSFTEFQVGDIYDIFDFSGESSTGAVYVNHPLVRSRRSNLDIYTGLDYKSIKNFRQDEQTSHDEIRVASAGLDYDIIDNFKGRNFFKVKISTGLPEFLNGSDDQNPESSRLGAGNDFMFQTFEYIRVQSLPGHCLLVLKGLFQNTDDVLPASEQLAIGGYDTVRGFNQATFLGDSGFVLRGELRFPLPFLQDMHIGSSSRTLAETLQFNVFYDFGRVTVENPAFGDIKDRELKGAGAGFRILLPFELNLEFSVGFPVDNEDYVIASDADHEDPYYYVKANYKFF